MGLLGGGAQPDRQRDDLNMLQTGEHMWEWVWAGWGGVRLGWGFSSEQPFPQMCKVNSRLFSSLAQTYAMINNESTRS